MSDIKKRLAHVRAKYFPTLSWGPATVRDAVKRGMRDLTRAYESTQWGPGALEQVKTEFDEAWHRVMRRRPEELAHSMSKSGRFFREPDAAALERARKYFGLDDEEAKKDLGMNEYHALALLMAEVLFGDGDRGRPRQTKTWTRERYIELALVRAEMLSENPKLSDAAIAKRLVKTDAYKHYDAATLRQRIIDAKRCFDEFGPV